MSMKKILFPERGVESIFKPQSGVIILTCLRHFLRSMPFFDLILSSLQHLNPYNFTPD
jgi:hypothetical protein